MKQLATTALVNLLLVINVMANAAEYPKAPEFQLPTQNGNIDLSALQGKVIYVDFWASWCRPCKNSFPWMIAMKQRFRDKPFEIIAINLDNDKALADEFLASQAINFPVGFDPEARIAESYGVEGMPSSFLIDPQGKLRIRYTGFWNKSKNEKEKSIDDLLKQYKSAPNKPFN